MRIQDVPARLETLFNAWTSGPGHDMRPLEPLERLAVGGDAGNDDRAALEWVKALHGAFYDVAPVRGANRFLEMEETLAGVFGRISVGAERAFWVFIVRVVLLLAREKEEKTQRQGQQSVDGKDPENRTECAGGDPGCNAEAALAGVDNKKTATISSELPTQSKKGGKKKRKKQSQPYAPLAFMVVNALKKLLEPEDRSAQRVYCQKQGRSNVALRDFCVRGLRDSSYVVSPTSLHYPASAIAPLSRTDHNGSSLGGSIYTGSKASRGDH